MTWRRTTCSSCIRIENLYGRLPMPASPLTPDQVRQAVAKLPRVPLAHLPTPLEEVPRFASA